MKNRSIIISTIVLCIAFASCTTPMHRGPQVKSAKTGSAAAQDSQGAPQNCNLNESLPLLTATHPNAWNGEVFLLLERAAAYCDYGYELYSCFKLDSCRENLDTTKWTKFHRAKCSVFFKHRLKVLSAKPQGREWLLVFRDEKTGDTLYSKTTNGVYHEIVRDSDLDCALRRWKGSMVYSAHGFITTLKDGKTGTIKVRLQDPLKVIDVCSGVTPVPPKPIRLVVETSNGEKGFIPLYYSWTNVKKEFRHDGNPWDDDIFEANPKFLFNANEETWEIVNNHSIHIGMTRDQVRLSWGLSRERRTTVYKGKPHECWIYPAETLYFDGQKLIGVNKGSSLNAPPGK